MEKHLKDIKYILAFIAMLLGITMVCQICLLVETIKPSVAEAKSEEIMKVDLVKIGGGNVFLYDFVEKPY